MGIGRLLEPLQADCGDVVIADRLAGGIRPGAMSWSRGCSSRRAFTGSADDRMQLGALGMEFASETVVGVLRQKRRIAAVPITCYPRGGMEARRAARCLAPCAIHADVLAVEPVPTARNRLSGGRCNRDGGDPTRTSERVRSNLGRLSASVRGRWADHGYQPGAVRNPGKEPLNGCWCAPPKKGLRVLCRSFTSKQGMLAGLLLFVIVGLMELRTVIRWPPPARYFVCQNTPGSSQSWWGSS